MTDIQEKGEKCKDQPWYSMVIGRKWTHVDLTNSMHVYAVNGSCFPFTQMKINVKKLRPDMKLGMLFLFLHLLRLSLLVHMLMQGDTKQ